MAGLHFPLTDLMTRPLAVTGPRVCLALRSSGSNWTTFSPDRLDDTTTGCDRTSCMSRSVEFWLELGYFLFSNLQSMEFNVG
ncbi:hypothetical protein AVEN_128027-1 [Araneus ventricosus]|uniref:Uncharacterized protein n=1 Tax=Araneus ventricosus TaxID=182803 RepID=A0A4Y1ZZI6_ARAVE|nr:hypothetical protein AVEN_128027-1 [Araneus ventricosus]